jgi:hypothetical protein
MSARGGPLIRETVAAEGISMTPIDQLNRMAVDGLLADVERVLALTDLEGVRGDREIVDDAIANAQRNYIDLVRRRRPLMLADADETRFQSAMDRILARMRFFGKAV